MFFLRLSTVLAKLKCQNYTLRFLKKWREKQSREDLNHEGLHVQIKPSSKVLNSNASVGDWLINQQLGCVRDPIEY